jgi:hypothetical protein
MNSEPKENVWQKLARAKWVEGQTFTLIASTYLVKDEATKKETSYISERHLVLANGRLACTCDINPNTCVTYLDCPPVTRAVQSLCAQSAVMLWNSYVWQRRLARGKVA